ncbi:TolC family protein [Hymenobacter properus]|uniref:TolC family protein n=1 Tax=Hymenobacter properus TaxID=2791026 RepID=A0A931BIZ9_9BACT|nr:TolC family protein [Hymenobacter properus]MBF9144544.1 TolC family protein [Hymenobacter properus]MBR7723362.1 TolC family protein [Microvirga sp. SRT04]
MRSTLLSIALLLLPGLALSTRGQEPGAPAVLSPAPVLAPPASPRRLEDFLLVARQNSPLLRESANQVTQNRLDSLVRARQNGVQVAGIGSALYYPSVTNSRGENVLGYDEAISNGGNYAAIAQASKPILNRFQLQTDYQILASQGQVLRNTGRLSALDLRRSITDQFLTAYAAETQLTFSRSLLTLLRQQDAQLRQLVNGGIFKQTQYLSFYLSVRTQEVTVEQDRLAYRRELGTLRALAGVADTALVTLEAPVPPARRPLAGLLAPAQRQYTLDSLRLRLDRRAVDAAYRPKLSAVLDAGLQSSSYLPVALAHSVGFGGGLQLSLPIFDGHQRQLQYQRLDLSEQSRRGYRQFLTVQRRQQYEQLEGLIRASDALLGRIREQVKVADALVGAARQQLATGDVAILDYLNLVTSYRTLQFSLTQAQTDQLRSRFALDYLAEQ